MTSLNIVKESVCFDGRVLFCSYESACIQGPFNFSIFLPKTKKTAYPVLFWLSGLTCTDENFMAKAGAQRLASALGMIIVAPDTSPRHAQIAGERESYDLGIGASFYVDATQSPWSKNYRMYSLITEELVPLIDDHFPTQKGARGISGHSMGGHGALVLGLKNPQIFQSISAFAPICHPSVSPWGQKAFLAYLGEDVAAWHSYDACELLKVVTEKRPTLVYQGDQDEYLSRELMTEDLVYAAKCADYPLELRMSFGYDHSYYFIQSFIDDHLRFHYRALT